MSMAGRLGCEGGLLCGSSQEWVLRRFLHSQELLKGIQDRFGPNAEPNPVTVGTLQGSETREG
jgi:hypothetical protein